LTWWWRRHLGTCNRSTAHVPPVNPTGEDRPMTTTVTPIPTHEQVCALAAAVRDGELSPEQREQLARLLHRIDSAYGLAPLAAQRYPDAPERRDAYVAACWEPVGAAYGELLAAVTTAHPGGQGGA
jgi:hypothetical protein